MEALGEMEARMDAKQEGKQRKEEKMKELEKEEVKRGSGCEEPMGWRGLHGRGLDQEGQEQGQK